jgi:hypothetical protein
VAQWTAPAAPRAAATSSGASVANPVQVWAAMVGNLYALQRKTWTNLAGLNGTKDSQER